LPVSSLDLQSPLLESLRKEEEGRRSELEESKFSKPDFPFFPFSLLVLLVLLVLSWFFWFFWFFWVLLVRLILFFLCTFPFFPFFNWFSWVHLLIFLLSFPPFQFPLKRMTRIPPSGSWTTTTSRTCGDSSGRSTVSCHLSSPPP